MPQIAAGSETPHNFTTWVYPVAAYQIRECTDPTCRFRFPLPEGEQLGNRCPRCGGITRCVHALSIHQESNVKTAPSHSHPLSAHPAPPPLSALLDNVRSLFNVGSIFRSADGAGFGHLYLCGYTPTPHNRKLAKTALGAEHSVAWSHHNNSVDLAKQLLADGCRLWALEESPDAKSLFDAVLPVEQVVLVVGNEVAGVDMDLLSLCERKFSIPMRGRKRSLNVATAFGIAAVILANQPRIPDASAGSEERW